MEQEANESDLAPRSYSEPGDNKNVSGVHESAVKMNGTVDSEVALMSEGDALTAEGRLKRLEKLFLGGPLSSGGQCYSMETLLDVLIVLHDECINSSMRREKTVSDFIEYAGRAERATVGCSRAMPLVGVSREKVSLWLGLCGIGSIIGPFFYATHADF
ncbi:hypothetical protein FHG87_014653 [Trinorchestia longiramus]|nr:hypothetical protein FHG87_014653 [Trinorchestia longiramus]